MGKSDKNGEARHSIYVIELDPAVLEDRRFRGANPDYVAGRPCVYVGMTGCTPEERFAQHKKGYKAARIPRKYGVRLKPQLYQSHNPMTYKDACRMEVEKARQLRSRGYGVWQN